MTETSHAVFLSYASQDAEAARKICEALRAAGIEVFLDQSELRGGDAWDQKIRREIRDCALFVPVISVNTASRLEGYFRLEWKLAVDRSHLMAAEKPFLLPVIIDATQESNAHVPDRFREVQSALYAARRYEEAIAGYTQVISLAPDFNETYAERGFAYYALGDLERARASCEMKPDFWFSQQCLAVIFDKIGRHADAEVELTKLKVNGDAAAYQYATIYAQWGNNLKALEWLETALRLRDPGLARLKVDQLLDPLRKEPRFQALMRQLKFPS
jgi:tetratricopeptide (TPR) repeat protein